MGEGILFFVFSLMMSVDSFDSCFVCVCFGFFLVSLVIEILEAKSFLDVESKINNS